MPAYFDTGFCVRTPSWHRQERLENAYPDSIDQALEWAGLLWEPMVTPSYIKVERPAGVDADGNLTTAPEYVETPTRIVVRDDTFGFLGAVTEKWAPIGNRTMAEVAEAMVGAGAKFETMGSVEEGRKVWALVYLDEPFTVPGDDSVQLPYVAVLNAHDGSGALRAIPTSVRVVCWNTWQMALNEGIRSGRMYTFRHTGNVADRIEDAKATMAGLREGVQQYLELATELTGYRVDHDTMLRFLSAFIPEPPAGITSDRVKANIATARSTFISLYEGGTDASEATNGALRGTGMGLLNAATEYLDHVRGFRTADTYLGRTILRAEPLKAQALGIIREVCAA